MDMSERDLVIAGLDIQSKGSDSSKNTNMSTPDGARWRSYRDLSRTVVSDTLRSRRGGVVTASVI